MRELRRGGGGGGDMLLPCNLYVHAIFKASVRRSSLLDYIAFCMFDSSTDDGRMKNLESI